MVCIITCGWPYSEEFISELDRSELEREDGLTNELDLCAFILEDDESELVLPEWS